MGGSTGTGKESGKRTGYQSGDSVEAGMCLEVLCTRRSSLCVKEWGTVRKIVWGEKCGCKDGEGENVRVPVVIAMCAEEQQWQKEQGWGTSVEAGQGFPTKSVR